MQICHGTLVFLSFCLFSVSSSDSEFCIKKFFSTRQILKNFLALSFCLDENFCTSSQLLQPFPARDFF